MNFQQFTSPQKKEFFSTKLQEEQYFSKFLTPDRKTNYQTPGSVSQLSDQENMFSPQTHNLFSSEKNKSFTSPSFKKFGERNTTDRFIPIRHNNNIQRNLFGLSSEDLGIQNGSDKKKKFSLFGKIDIPASTVSEEQSSNSEIQTEEEEKKKNYQNMLKQQTLNITPQKTEVDPQDEDDNSNSQNSNSFLKFKNKNLFNGNDNICSANKQLDFYNTKNNMFLGLDCKNNENINSTNNLFGGFQSGTYNQKYQKRKIQTTPEKVLDAPGLQDDFYVDILDWGSNGFISVVLEGTIYLWDSNPESEAKTVALAVEENQQQFTSLQFNKNSSKIAVGEKGGLIKIFDVQNKNHAIFESKDHTSRVGNIQWINNNVFASGSKDKTMILHDIRDKNKIFQYKDHKQEICGLAACYNEQQLATGGNDNLVFLYDLRSRQKQFCFKDHRAGVRALTFSPHQHGILLTGGGTKDKTIKTWDTLNNTLISSIPVQSQVCKLLFSENTNEFISSHGFEENCMIVWKCQNLKSHNFQKLQILDGHNSRVLYMALSPDKQKIVTGAGDETLKFWNVFPEKPKYQNQSLLTNFSSLR